MRNTDSINEAFAQSIDTREIDAERLLEYFDQMEFSRIPIREAEESTKGKDIWRVVLINLVTRQDPLALEIWDEITIGRRLGSPKVDIDLSPHNGLELGVSRVHARIKPTAEALLLYDLESTNGTFANATKATVDQPVKLKDNDILAFGALKFLIKMVKHPGDKEGASSSKKKTKRSTS
jgi:hypothetical protein